MMCLFNPHPEFLPPLLVLFGEWPKKVFENIVSDPGGDFVSLKLENKLVEDANMLCYFRCSEEQTVQMPFISKNNN